MMITIRLNVFKPMFTLEGAFKVGHGGKVEEKWKGGRYKAKDERKRGESERHGKGDAS